MCSVRLEDGMRGGDHNKALASLYVRLLVEDLSISEWQEPVCAHVCWWHLRGGWFEV